MQFSISKCFFSAAFLLFVLCMLFSQDEQGGAEDSERAGLAALPIECALLATVLLHLALCPYTKVEESFNMQAVHDILYHRTNIRQYDHLEFPGVVPRTFVGPLALALLSAPGAALLTPLCGKFAVQLLVRFVLGAVSVFAFYRFRQSVEQVFGRQVAVWLVCITVTQFHFMFYLSRTLPNMLAMPLVLLAVSYWMRQEHGAFLCWSGAAILLFRAELALLLGILLLMELISGRLPLLRCVRLCVPAALALLLLTFSVDSLFWRRPVWPEGEVLWFNVILNKSSEWGTSPALWYWYSALPRALGCSLALVPVGLALDGRARLLAAPALLFVALYSLLPHKELRFVIYVVPLLNVAAARACHAIWEGRLKSAWRSYLATAMCCHLLANVALTALLVAVARHNYPGGAALARLQHLEPDAAYVHIDVYSAQTGVTRFLQHRDNWRYNKTEGLAPDSPDMNSYTHLLIEAKSKRSVTLKPYENSHMILDSVDVFSHIQFNYDHFPPLRLRMRPAIFLLYNNVPENVRWPVDESDIYPEKKEEAAKVTDFVEDNPTPAVENAGTSQTEKPKEANEGLVFTDEETEKDFKDDVVVSHVAASLPPDEDDTDDRFSELSEGSLS